MRVSPADAGLLEAGLIFKKCCLWLHSRTGFPIRINIVIKMCSLPHIIDVRHPGDSIVGATQCVAQGDPSGRPYVKDTPPKACYLALDCPIKSNSINCALRRNYGFICRGKAEPCPGRGKPRPYNTTRGLMAALSYIFACLITLSLMLLSQPIRALADENQPNEQPVKLEEVVVEGEAPSTEQPQQDLAAFGEILKIDDIPGIPISLPEALETAVGLSVRDFGGLGKLSTISLRGLSSRDVLVMLDGVPINGGGLGTVDLSDIPLADVERIEVLRGPEAALFGNNSAGGIVNIVREAEKKRFSRYSIKAGSFGYLTGDLFLSDRSDKLGYFAHLYSTTFRGGFKYLDDNGTSLDSSDDFIAARENNEYDSQGFFSGLSIDSNDWVYKFDIDTNHSRKGIPGLTTFPTPDADESDSRLLLHLRGSNENIAGGAGELNLDLNLLRTSRTYIDPSGEGIGTPTSSNWIETALGGAVEYAEFPGQSHHFTIGSDWGTDSFKPNQGDAHRRDNIGVYMRDEITLGDSLIVPAIRYDSIGKVGTRWSPKLGWRCKLNDELDIKANWGAAFRAPTFEELYRNEGFITGNPGLLPEKTRMADAGFVYEKKPLRIEADYFTGRARDLIEYVLGSGHRYHPLNFGRAKLSGFEFSMKYDLCDAWRIEGNVAHTDAIDASDKDSITYGKQIPGRPKWDAYAGLIYDNPNGACGGHLTAYFAAGRFLTAANTKELGDDTSINIGFNYALNKGSKLALEVKNLLGEDLLDVRGFPLPGRTFVLSITQEV